MAPHSLKNLFDYFKDSIKDCGESSISVSNKGGGEREKDIGGRWGWGRKGKRRRERRKGRRREKAEEVGTPDDDR